MTSTKRLKIFRQNSHGVWSCWVSQQLEQKCGCSWGNPGSSRCSPKSRWHWAEFVLFFWKLWLAEPGLSDPWDIRAGPGWVSEINRMWLWEVWDKLLLALFPPPAYGHSTMARHHLSSRGHLSAEGDKASFRGSKGLGVGTGPWSWVRRTVWWTTCISGSFLHPSLCHVTLQLPIKRKSIFPTSNAVFNQETCFGQWDISNSTGLAMGLQSQFCFVFWLHCVACGILVPWWGIEPMSSAMEPQSLKHWTTRQVPTTCFGLQNSSAF